MKLWKITLPAISLFLLIGACSLFSNSPIPTITPVPTNAPGTLLIGKWQDNSTKQIIEFTEDSYILYDFPAPNNKLYVKYSLLNDHTIQLDIQSSTPFEFKVNKDTLTRTNRDGTISTYSRIASP